MGEICDILALTPDNELAILELKNAEDRYIIQQLTRYHANLLEGRPFADVINYQKPVRLIALAPTFHRHNHIERDFSRLSFEFVKLRVLKEDQFYLEFSFEDVTYPSVRTPIPYQEVDLVGPPEAVTDVPANLLTWLGTCSAAEQ
ncbi:hypothetical protein [Pseudanabaena sp. FACHB-2040]|uniref:hypothetical protein n=1 Tax=Pseudanabaena sp. FACHB-2040 TaxID=2692859 RepID=UPI0016829F91|nr:hypothetical protein [Pseudanabaena sp. FACHB-2040]